MSPRHLAPLTIATLAFLPFAAGAVFADGDDCEPVVSASSEGEATISEFPEGTVLWDQTYDCSILGVASQDSSGFVAFETECADDFVVPPGVQWDVQHVVVKGFYLLLDAGPASAVNLVIYEDDSGVPGSAVATFDGLTPVAGLGDGNFVLQLTSMTLLDPGRYWVSVQADMPFLDKGLWFWRVRHDATELERVFRDLGDFFHTGCTDFDQASDCGLLVDLEKPDHCFAILGDLIEPEVCADLEILKTASRRTVPVGELITYFLVVSNRGPDDAYDVEVHDALPDELDFRSLRRPTGWSSSVLGDVVHLSLAHFPAGATAMFEIEARVLEANFQLTNVATVTSSTEDCNLDNNEAEVTVKAHMPSDPSVPALSEIGALLLALLMGATFVVFASRRA